MQDSDTPWTHWRNSNVAVVEDFSTLKCLLSSLQRSVNFLSLTSAGKHNVLSVVSVFPTIKKKKKKKFSGGSS